MANLGYSYVNPYPDRMSADVYHLSDHRVKGDTVLAADKNPGCCGTGFALLDNDSAGDPGRRGNSNNHREDGQNVLFGDGRVMFERSANVGPGGDNIYTSKWAGA